MEVFPTWAARLRGDWEKEMESIGRREAEAITAQWSLIQKQMEALMHDLLAVQQQVAEVKHHSHQALVQVKHTLDDNERELSGERDHRLAMEERFDEELRQLREGLELEARQREDSDAGLSSRMVPKLEVLAESLDAFLPELGALCEGLGRESGERRAGEESLLRSVRACEQEVREQGALQRASMQGLQAAIERDRNDRSLAAQSSRPQFNVHMDLSPQKSEPPTLEDVCRELGEALIPQLRGRQEVPSEAAGEQASGMAQLKQRVQDISARVENEGTARGELVEEIDSLLSASRSRMQSVIKGYAEAERQAREELALAVRAQLEKQSRAAESWQEAIQSKLLRRQEHEGKDCAVPRVEELAKEIRELHQALQSGLADERKARRADLAAFEEQLAGLDGFFKDVGDCFFGHGVNPPRLNSARGPPPPRSVKADAAREARSEASSAAAVAAIAAAAAKGASEVDMRTFKHM